jgi:hypothetical protein
MQLLCFVMPFTAIPHGKLLVHMLQGLLYYTLLDVLIIINEGKAASV